MVVAVTVGVLVAATLGVVAITAGDGDDAAATTTVDHAGHTGASTVPGDTAAPGASDAGTHDDHAGSVLPGCDPAELHAVMMMFTPVAADELLDGPCPWPYDAAISLVGGEEDPSIAAEYEPRRYAEVFDVLTAERYGMCSVSLLPDPTVDGLVFGFGADLHPGGCADGTVTVELDIREYATRAFRDSAAHALAGERTLVLGRWVITIAGTDTDGADRLAELLVPLGAVTVSS